MDYEKKYKDAVRIAKSFYEGEAVSFLGTIFPELRESEDERVWKELKEAFEAYDIESSWNGIPIRSVFAWLEKQKDLLEKQKDLDKMIVVSPEVWDNAISDAFENGKKEGEKQKENPKSADSIPSDCVSDAKCEDRWHKVGDSLPANPREVLCKDEAGNYFIGRYYVGEGWEISNYDDEDKPHHLNPPVSKWIDFPSEKQKEQKPVEVKDPFSNANFVRGYESGYTDAIREQKPAEWSEEDERILKGIIGKIDHDQTYGVSKVEMLSFLKSLRPQSKQEWSGEDKAIVGCIAVCLDGQFVTEAARKQCLEWFNKHRRDFLNRPSWKPSEEQMEAFRSYIKDFQEKAEAAVGGWNNFDAMIRLFEQLQKL